MSDAFAPPKPNEFESAVSIFLSTGSRTISKLQVGSILPGDICGGKNCPRSVIKQTTASTAPAAPSKWPMLDFVELTKRFRLAGTLAPPVFVRGN